MTLDYLFRRRPEQFRELSMPSIPLRVRPLQSGDLVGSVNPADLFISVAAKPGSTVATASMTLIGAAGLVDGGVRGEVAGLAG
jgi:hypothetical protein